MNKREQDRAHQEEQRRIRAGIARAEALTADDLTWRPYYPNNSLACGQEGWYCVVQDEGEDSASKYSILFQYHEDEDYVTRSGAVELYVVCGRSYFDLDGPLVYPEPDWRGLDLWDDVYQINDHGRFIHAYPTLELAKGKVLWMLRMHGYVLSHLLDDGEDGGRPS